MGFVKTRRLAAMQKQQRAKAGVVRKDCFVIESGMSCILRYSMVYE